MNTNIGLSPLNELEPTTRAASVVEAMRTAILNGTLAAGAPLREVHLSTALGVSRAPVREAIAQLIEEGLATKIPYKGARVAEINKDLTSEIATVRRMVESSVIEQAVTLSGESMKPLLDARISEMAEAAENGDMAASVRAHMEFHRHFYDSCHNSVLADMWSTWEGQLQLFFLFDHSVFKNLASVVDEHRILADAAYAGNHEQLERVVERHIKGQTDPEHWNRNPAPGLES